MDAYTTRAVRLFRSFFAIPLREREAMCAEAVAAGGRPCHHPGCLNCFGSTEAWFGERGIQIEELPVGAL